jgi:acyl-CoA thioester hydrolase
MSPKNQKEEAVVDLTRAENYQHWIKDTIRFADLDTLGHVNNVAFATFFESGRVRFFADHQSPVDSTELIWMAVKMTIEFKAQMNWPGEVDIGSRISHMGRTSMIIGAGLFVDGQCTSTAECVMVFVDPVTSRPREIPEDIRATFQYSGS